jgi:3-carboxy-cis,cis-muconate cycloisomerase
MVVVLTNLTGSLAKFARDLALLMQAEVGEASEGGSQSAGGSSTMPHKHNPVASAAVIAAHERMPGLAATMLHALPQEHERGLGLWQAEWEIVPEAFRLTAAALAYAIEIADAMRVNQRRMEDNFDALRGTTMAESISAALAMKIGRLRAHELLREATERANANKLHLRTVLKNMPEVSSELTDERIDQLMEPRAYLGSAQRFIDRVLGESDAGN